MNYERNKIYFFPIPKKEAKRKKIEPNPIIAIIIGILLLWSGTMGIDTITKFFDPLGETQMYPVIDRSLSLWGGTQGGFPMGVVFGLVAIGIGAIWIMIVILFNVICAQKAKKYNVNRIIVTDSEIDNVCKEYLNDNFKSMAFKKLGFEENQVREIEPIQFEGYYYNDLKSSEWVLQVGEDGRRRSSHYKATILFFSVDQVYCYQHIFSLLEDGVRQDVSEEYFYRDIISVSTRSNTIKYKNKEDTILVDVEEFTLTTTGGVVISASIFDSESAENSVQRIRSLLKSKKQLS